MQRPPSWSNNPPGGGGGGLSRFRSAPAGNWLESLLEGDESDPLKSNQNFTQLLATGQNSSPVDDGCFFDSSPNVSFSLNGETSGQVYGAESSMIDMDMENFLEDAVPRRVRAKRGFATHPRSIAERVRRTRISDRIRKLQELVPNMDKQTNTADMLDEALEYVKTLQKQIQEFEFADGIFSNRFGTKTHHLGKLNLGRSFRSIKVNVHVARGNNHKIKPNVETTSPGKRVYGVT